MIAVIVCRRDYDEALRRISALRETGNEPSLLQVVDLAVSGELEWLRGNKAAAQPFLHEAERQFTQLRERNEGGVMVLEELIRVEACLGQRDAVERLAPDLRAARRMDKWTSPIAEEKIASAYAIMGDADHALPLLETILHQSYAGAITRAYLRLDPTVRSHP